MKKLTVILFATLSLILSACGSPEKSRKALYEGESLLMEKGDFAAAEVKFTQAIQYDQQNYQAYYYRGCSKFNRALFDQAILDFEKALELKPDYYDAEFALGRIYSIKQDFDMACYYYKAAETHGRQNMDDYVRSCR